MSKEGDAPVPDGVSSRAKSVLVWTGRVVALLWIALSLLLAGSGLINSISLNIELASRRTVFEVWAVLHALHLLFALTAILGVAWALTRRRLLTALLFSLLAWPMGYVIEANRCDYPACRAMAWAALPPGAFDWSVRIRPVTDRGEAETIASAALFKAGSGLGTYQAKRFEDYWIVPTIDDDGRPGPHAVRVDMRTGATSFVPCPAHRMLCGMDFPTESDGRRVFGGARLGLAVSFPAGLAVCPARSHDEDVQIDEPRGFYGMLRPADIPCDDIDLSRTLGLEAVKARTVTEALDEPCKSLSPSVLEAFGGRAPGFADHPGVVCEEVGDDQIAVSVYAAAGPGPAAPKTLYVAWMLTDPAHLAEDARAFEAFLTTARIGAPAAR